MASNVSAPCFYYGSRPVYPVKSDPGTLKQLECPVCQYLLQKPVEVCAEAHMLCKTCLPSGLKTCPVCRDPLKAKIEVSQVVNRILMNTVVRCPNEGCPDTFDFSETEAHLTRCPENIVTCEGDCGEPPAKRKKMFEHMSHCSKVFQCECRQVFFPFRDMFSSKAMQHVRSQPALHPEAIANVKGVEAAVQTDPVELPQNQISTLTKDKKIHRILDTECVAVSGDKVYQAVNNPREFLIKIDALARATNPGEYDFEYEIELNFMTQRSGYHEPVEKCIRLFFHRRRPEYSSEKENELTIVLYSSTRNKYVKYINFTFYSGQDNKAIKQSRHDIEYLGMCCKCPDVIPNQDGQYLVRVIIEG
ncbi:RING finger protein [Sansalvadorimonas verongulae]|uniref:hypothetical protein n=1 Tax=Sansalvadorimonas verongulae TaxID=2172824 RepID=UPI0012BC4987|nr:hypothetical protein [Sansalvadorimonas verongulae]MTI12774.1 hypothetical protein [Sansalvadorimonas verongulae]